MERQSKLAPRGGRLLPQSCGSCKYIEQGFVKLARICLCPSFLSTRTRSPTRKRFQHVIREGTFRPPFLKNKLRALPSRCLADDLTEEPITSSHFDHITPNTLAGTLRPLIGSHWTDGHSGRSQHMKKILTFNGLKKRSDCREGLLRIQCQDTGVCSCAAKQNSDDVVGRFWSSFRHDGSTSRALLSSSGESRDAQRLPELPPRTRTMQIHYPDININGSNMKGKKECTVPNFN
nr:hypothetical protein Iba_chr15fCG3090 [Ipomoea batatas]